MVLEGVLVLVMMTEGTLPMPSVLAPKLKKALKLIALDLLKKLGYQNLI